MNIRRLKMKKEEQEGAGPTLADELRAVADELATFPELHVADRLIALADTHQAATTYPGHPIPPAICEKLRGYAHRLRQLRGPEREVRDALRDEAKRLEKLS